MFDRWILHCVLHRPVGYCILHLGFGDGDKTTGKGCYCRFGGIQGLTAITLKTAAISGLSR